jgi:hypothetical protein
MKKYIKIWVTEKRMTNKIRSAGRPLIKDGEKGLRNGGFGWVLDWFWVFGFWGNRQRRGAHVFPPEIGSRVAHLCTWGNFRICAELRREWIEGIGFGWELVRLVEVATWGFGGGGTSSVLPSVCWGALVGWVL